MKRPDVIEQLWNWGITEATIKKFKLGWNPKVQYRPITSWGLPYSENDNGRESCIRFPIGIVFPCWDGDEVIRMQIRTEDDKQKYYQIKNGEGTAPVILGNPKAPVWIPLETIRDGYLALQELEKYDVAIFVLGGASNRPTQEQHEKLINSELILNALDADYAGAVNSHSFETMEHNHAFLGKMCTPILFGGLFQNNAEKI